MECLKELYQALQLSSADYGQAIQRDTVIEVFQEALVQAPVLADGYDSDDESSEPFRTSREQAGWVLNQLIEYGWLEKQVDEANLQSTFGFTRFGRQFTEPFIESRAMARTRHRNTRNTRNSLDPFRNAATYTICLTPMSTQSASSVTLPM